MKRSKRILSLFTVFVMMISIVHGSLYTAVKAYEKNAVSKGGNEAYTVFASETQGLYKAEDEVKIIVELLENKRELLPLLSTSEEKYMRKEDVMGTLSSDRYKSELFASSSSVTKRQSAISQARRYSPQSVLRPEDKQGIMSTMRYNDATQSLSIDNLKEDGIKFTVTARYDYLLNAFAITTSYKEALKIAEKPYVKAVYIDREYEYPQEPHMTHSNKLINSGYSWDSNYDGEGMLAAVIDSGFDITHQDMQMSDEDVKKAKIKSAEDLEALKISANINRGKWYSNKFPFGFNYANPKDGERIAEDIKNPKASMHGMHVAGTVAANGKIKGVAPKAQILGMRVFTEGKGTADSIYLYAIQDAVKLGADAINMSLGGPLGVSKKINSALDGAFNKAIESGAVLSISAGNDGNFGFYKAIPRSDNPDYGVTGAPSVYKQSIGVAAAANSDMKMRYVLVDGKDKYAYRETDTTSGAYGKTFEVVDCGLGKKEEVADKDLQGKAALIERGEINFSEKISNAAEKGAGLVIIYNHEKGGDEFFGMAIGDTKVPSIAMKHSDGLKLKNGHHTVEVKEEEMDMQNPNAGDMGDFSSWGPSVDFEMKPEISAPGERIYSTVYENKYASMDGTSMAAPHICGAAILVKQRLMHDYPDIKGKELSILMKNMMMSTATPITDKKTNSYISPRKQGAGMVNLKGATESDVIILGDEGISKVNLKSINKAKDFSVRLKNLFNKEHSYDAKIVVCTNDTEGYDFNLREKTIYERELGEVTVPASSEIVKNISVDVSDYHDELIQKMPNGYWVEGYVFFKAKELNVPDISIPFIAFNGDFDRIPVLEKSIYDMNIADGDLPTWYDKDGKSSDYTELETSIKDKYTILGLDRDGTYKNLKCRKDKIAISPNGDKIRDNVAFNGVFTRNYANFSMALYNIGADGDIGSIVQEQRVYLSSGEKNAHMGRDNFPKSTQSRDWNMTPERSIKDGKYILRISVNPYVNQAEEYKQNYDFPLIIDREIPKVSKVEEKDGIIRLYVSDNIIPGVEGSGVKFIKYKLKDSQVWTDLENIKDEDTFFDINSDSNKLENVTVHIEDWAGNFVEDDALSLKEKVSYGKIIIKEKIKGSDVSSTGSTYIVKNEVTGEVVDNLQRVKVGKYIVSIDKKAGGYKLISEKEVNVEIKEEDLVKEVVFEFEKITGYDVTVALETANAYKGGATVKAVSKKDSTEVYDFKEGGKYGQNRYFDAVLPEGEYTITVTLNGEGSENYVVLPNNISINISRNEVILCKVQDKKEVRYSIAVVGDGLSDNVKLKYAVYDYLGNTVESKNLAAGDYYVEITEIPEGYMLVGEGFKDVKLSGNETEKTVHFTFKAVGDGRGSISIVQNKDDKYKLSNDDFVVENYNGERFRDPSSLPYGNYYIAIDKELLQTKYKGYDAYFENGKNNIRVDIDEENPNKEVKVSLKRINESKEMATVTAWLKPKDDSSINRYPFREKLSLVFTNVDGEKFTKEYSMFGINKWELPSDWYDISAEYIAPGYAVEFYKDIDGRKEKIAGALFKGEFETLDIVSFKEDAPPKDKGSITLKFIDIDSKEELSGAKILASDGKTTITDIAELKSVDFGTWNIKITEAPKGYDVFGQRETVVTLDKLSPQREVSFSFKKKEVNPNPGDGDGKSSVKIYLSQTPYGILPRDFKPELLLKDASGTEVSNITVEKDSIYYVIKNIKKGSYSLGIKNLPTGVKLEKEVGFDADGENPVNSGAQLMMRIIEEKVEGSTLKISYKLPTGVYTYSADFELKNEAGEIVGGGVESGYSTRTYTYKGLKKGSYSLKLKNPPSNYKTDQEVYNIEVDGVNEKTLTINFVENKDDGPNDGENGFDISLQSANKNDTFKPELEVKDSTGKEYKASLKYGTSYEVRGLGAGVYTARIKNLPQGYEQKEVSIKLKDGNKPSYYGSYTVRYYDPQKEPKNDGALSFYIQGTIKGEPKIVLKKGGEIVDKTFTKSKYSNSYGTNALEFGEYEYEISLEGYSLIPSSGSESITPLDNIKIITVRATANAPSGKDAGLFEIYEKYKDLDPMAFKQDGYLNFFMALESLKSADENMDAVQKDELKSRFFNALNSLESSGTAKIDFITWEYDDRNMSNYYLGGMRAVPGTHYSLSFHLKDGRTYDSDARIPLKEDSQVVVINREDIESVDVHIYMERGQLMGFDEKEVIRNVKVLDRIDLKPLIAEAEEKLKEKDKYNEEDVKKLEELLERAKETVELNDRDEVLKAELRDELRSAIDGLRLKEEKPIEPVKPVEPVTPVEPSRPSEPRYPLYPEPIRPAHPVRPEIPAINQEKKEEKHESGENIGVFIDIYVVPWAEDAINTLYKKGIVKGKSENMFKPMDKITRAELVAILVRAFNLNSDEDVEIKDLDKNAWYYNDVRIAAASGICSGYPDKTFRPNKNISREELIKIIITYMEKHMKINTDKNSVINIIDFENASEWAKEYLRKALILGILKGDANLRIKAEEDVTRAEAVLIIERCLRLMDDKNK